MLDLICGLFALLVVLFAITQRVDGRPGTAQEAPRLVSIQVEDSRAPAALEIVVAGRIHRSWPHCANHGSVRWGNCGAGIVEAVVEGGDSIEDVRFMLLGLPSDATDLDNDIQVWVTTPDAAKLCTLALASGYRGHWKSESCKPSG